MNNKQPRAKRSIDKYKICRRLYKAWKKAPELRLGQLIECSVPPHDVLEIFYAEDYDLIRKIEEFVSKPK